MRWSTLDRKRHRKQEKPKPTAEQLGARDSGSGGSLMVQWEAFRIAARRHGIVLTSNATPHEPISYSMLTDWTLPVSVTVQWHPEGPEWRVDSTRGSEYWNRVPGSRLQAPAR